MILYQNCTGIGGIYHERIDKTVTNRQYNN